MQNDARGLAESMNEHVLGVWELEALCYPSTNDRYQSNGINESTLDNNPKLSCIIAKLEHMVGLVWEKKIRNMAGRKHGLGIE